MKKDKKLIKSIPCVDASDFPRDVEEYCTDVGISTHYQNDIAQVDRQSSC